MNIPVFAKYQESRNRTAETQGYEATVEASQDDSMNIPVFAKYQESRTRTAETQGYEATV